MSLLSTAILLFGLVMAATVIILGSWDYRSRRPVAVQERFSPGRPSKHRISRIL